MEIPEIYEYYIEGNSKPTKADIEKANYTASIEEKMKNLLRRLSGVERPLKPRSTGITIVLDKMEPLNIEFLDIVHDYIDYIKIGWGLPLLSPPKTLHERIAMYHEYEVSVMAGGTLLELAVHRNAVKETLELLWELEFDAIEISSGFKIIPIDTRKRIAETASDMGFRVFIEIGRKRPQLRMSKQEFLAEVKEFYDLKNVWKIILDGREHGKNSCLYDSHGRPRMEYINLVLSKFDNKRFVFEAPRPYQQAHFIRLVGPNANLGNIPLHEVLSLESLRLGLRGDTLVSSLGIEIISSESPSSRFVYFVLQNHGMLSVREISRLTGLPQRTVYEALKSLREKGFIDYVYDKKRNERYWYAF